jgi:alanyl-tRNA synthetase
MNLDEVSKGHARTELRYLHEMTLRSDQANIVKLVPDKGGHVYLLLDKTIFHPKGGGQPSDIGTISGLEFKLTVKKAIHHQGVIVHWAKIVNGIPKLAPVTCTLDWAHRYSIMKRHTAAHLLDHCLGQFSNTHVVTTDSWLGDPCYVGYRGKAPHESLKDIELLANQKISSGGQVSIKFMSKEAAAPLLSQAPNFERIPDLEEIRLVILAGCAPIPCGGTHVSDLKELEQLSLLSLQELPDEAFRLYFQV